MPGIKILVPFQLPSYFVKISLIYRFARLGISSNVLRIAEVAIAPAKALRAKLNEAGYSPLYALPHD